MIYDIKVYPTIGETFYVQLNIPENRDEEEYVDIWIDDHLMNVEDWRWA